MKNFRLTYVYWIMIVSIITFSQENMSSTENPKIEGKEILINEKRINKNMFPKIFPQKHLHLLKKKIFIKKVRKQREIIVHIPGKIIIIRYNDCEKPVVKHKKCIAKKTSKCMFFHNSADSQLNQKNVFNKECSLNKFKNSKKNNDIPIGEGIFSRHQSDPSSEKNFNTIISKIFNDQESRNNGQQNIINDDRNRKINDMRNILDTQFIEFEKLTENTDINNMTIVNDTNNIINSSVTENNNLNFLRNKLDESQSNIVV